MSASTKTSVPVLSPGAIGRARDVTFSPESNPTSAGKVATHGGGASGKTPAAKAQTSNLGLSGSNATVVDEATNSSIIEPQLGMLQPRKSFLLKDILSQQPTAYVPAYVVERSSLPTERWVRKAGKAKWKPESNPRAGTPSLLVPGYKPPRADLSWMNAEDTTSSDDDGVLLSSSAGRRGNTPHYQLDSLFTRSPTPGGGGPRAHTSLTHFSTSELSPAPQPQGAASSPVRNAAAGGGPQVIVSNHSTTTEEFRTPHRSGGGASNVISRKPFLERGNGLLSSSPQSRPQSRQDNTTMPRSSSTSPPLVLNNKPVTLQSTPMNNGVQDAWCSSYVQLGPFRNLTIYEHDPPGRSINGIPIDVVPPGNKKLTPLEQHRVEHAQAEYMRARTPTVHHGHVSKDIARQTHIGLPASSPPAALRSTQEHTHFFSPSASSNGRSQGGQGVPHPAMHFALPSSIVLPLPNPVHAPSQLPPRSPAKLLPTCAHRAAAAAAASRGDADGDVVGCPDCRAVREALEAFDGVRESKEERLYQHQLDMWREQQLREEDSKTVPADMMRTKSGRLVRKLVILDEGPTVAQLYHGTSHEDREALYVSTCGGLSFDINKERFVHLMQKVLAPRIHVRLSDDQAAAMFVAFDVDGNGAVSYFEYLAVLTIQLLSADQRKFLDDLFTALYRLPFIDSGLDARTASKVMLEYRAQMQLEGELSMSLNGGRTASPPPAALSPQMIRRKSSVHSSVGGMLRRKSTKRLSTFDGDMSMMSDDAGNMSMMLHQSPNNHNNKKVVMEKSNYLSKAYITLERARKVVYDLKKHNPWFPHPLDDAFADALVHCFKPLKDEDRVNLPKFRMFIFCDDECMPALENLFPRE
ncbi:calcium-binding protein, putative [Bodo saltans]|uniref:Calcium-binding protein, putative n=1 Tax=Bodo saltans TaxID=75058 RepID=A0A0S4JLW7_BODSA|nr:calcium-binding protein, putative [Bodo saltans]|eukprot:CUG91625.1 calcium-binding protein, putative [Bodo saltans]